MDLSALWGKEALLLNLWTIQQHAARLVQRYARMLWLCVSGVGERQRWLIFIRLEQTAMRAHWTRPCRAYAA